MKDLISNEDDFIMGLDIIQDFKTKHPGKILMSRPVFQWLRALYQPKNMTCYAGRMFCTVYPDGSMTPCMFKREYRVTGGDVKSRFMSLNSIDKCFCKTNCYVEYNNLISMRLHTFFDFFYELFSERNLK